MAGHLTVEEVLVAVEQLPPQERERFDRAWSAFRIGKGTRSQVERWRAAAAFRFSQAQQRRLDGLLDKQNAGTLMDLEREELHTMLDEVERRNAAKAEAMHRLALMAEHELLQIFKDVQ